MGKIYITGDKHSDFQSPDDYQKVEKFCKQFSTTKEDFMIVLGDHGVRYYEDWRDLHAKKKLAKYPIRFIMLRGNHDKRTTQYGKNVYVDTDCVKGWFVEDPDYPDILYTTEYGWYKFAGHNVFVINGAYSVDKWYRLEMNERGFLNYRWFIDEQLTNEEKEDAEDLLFGTMERFWRTDFIVMSHTCPIGFKPTDNLLPGIDQSKVDESTEQWMQKLYDKIAEENLPLEQWYCGHWHIDRKVNPVRFMYHDIILLENKK